jgi:hypothetical protein
MEKSIEYVLFEASIVAVGLLLLVKIIQTMFPELSFEIVVLVSGALFHVLFEISGLNVMYALDYCKRIASKV